MPKDLSNLLSIQEAATEFFHGRKSPHTLRRWGVKGVGNPPQKLPLIRLGGQYFVDRDDLADFVEAICDPELYRRRKRTERVERARRKLAKAGC